MTDISVVLPTHKRPTELRQLLGDLLAAADSTKVHVEVLVVDSEAGGQGRLVVAECADGRLRYLETSNNLSAKRNAGAREAAGRVLIFLDDDVRVPDRDFLRAHVASHHGSCGPRLTSGAIVFPEAWVREGGIYRYKQSRQLRGEARPINESPHQFVAMNCSVLRETFDAIGGFDVDFARYGGEDFEFALRSLRHGVDLYFEPSATVVHLESRLSLRQFARKMYDFGHDGLPLVVEKAPEATEVASVGVVTSERARLGGLPARWLGSHYVVRALVRCASISKWTEFQLARVVAAAAAIAGYRDFTRSGPRLWPSTWGS